MLSRTLGRTLEELGRTMSAQEFSLQFRHYKRNPWGELRSDYRTAITAKATADYAGKSRSEDAKIDEFMLKFKTTEEVSDVVSEPDPVTHFSKHH